MVLPNLGCDCDCGCDMSNNGQKVVSTRFEQVFRIFRIQFIIFFLQVAVLTTQSHEGDRGSATDYAPLRDQDEIKGWRQIVETGRNSCSMQCWALENKWVKRGDGKI